MGLSQDEGRVMHLVCGGERCLLPHPEKVPCDDLEMGLWRDEMMKWSGGGRMRDGVTAGARATTMGDGT